MKTTIDIADDLLIKSKQLAHKENTTLRSLVEEGLALTLKRHAERKSFTWKPVVFRGTGMTAEFKDAPWSKIREAAYERPGRW